MSLDIMKIGADNIASVIYINHNGRFDNLLDIKKICENNNIFYIDMHSLYCKDSYKKLYIDGVHPNKIGHDIISYNFITHFKNFPTN